MIFDRFRLAKKQSQREQKNDEEVVNAERLVHEVLDSDVCEDDEDACCDESDGHIPIAWSSSFVASIGLNALSSLPELLFLHEGGSTTRFRFSKCGARNSAS